MPQICLYSLDVDVTNLGLDEMRSYPELVTSVMWTSIHVLMDMLLFLIVSARGVCCRCQSSPCPSPLALAEARLPLSPQGNDQVTTLECVSCPRFRVDDKRSDTHWYSSSDDDERIH